MPEDKKKIDIVYICSDLGTGGQERQLYNLVSLLSRKYQIAVIPLHYNLNDKYAILLGDLPIQLVNIGFGSKGNKIKKIRWYLKENQPTVIHSFSFHLNFLVWLVSLGSSSVVFGGIRNQLIRNKESMGIVLFYLSCLLPKRIISNNYNFIRGLDSFSKWVYSLNEKTYCVANGVDISSFQRSDNAETKVEENSYFLTASVSRLYPQKRIDLLIKLIAEIRDSGIQIKHFHAGNGPMLQNLKEKVHAHSLDSNFFFEGEITDLRSFLSDKKLFIHTADYEGCPNVVLEAMACSKPILTTNCGDSDRIVVSGINGYVVPIRDLTALRIKALELIEVENLAEMGEMSMKLVRENYSLDKYITNILNVYCNNSKLIRK